MIVVVLPASDLSIDVVRADVKINSIERLTIAGRKRYNLPGTNKLDVVDLEGFWAHVPTLLKGSGLLVMREMMSYGSWSGRVLSTGNALESLIVHNQSSRPLCTFCTWKF